jgi:multiple sugar transport system ATP-binding protein
MAEIRCEKVSKNFGDVQVLRDLSLTIKDGEFFTFVGPSGCGKSTVLNMIAGLEEVTAGTILFDGCPVNDRSPKDRDVAMVFQSYALYPHMTVRENIAFPLVMRRERRPVIEEETGRVADLLGLSGLLERRPRELSGGQRQRVALGRAIVRKPKVFLMDEPLSNLDARLRIEMRAELKRLHRELGITVVYVTHDQAEAMALSGRMAVLEKGVVRQVGTPKDIYRRPANMFVAGFIGSPSMNFLPCSVVGTEPLTIECLERQFAADADRVPSGARVIAGLRPEDVQIAQVKSAGAVEVKVMMTEPTGAELWVDCRWQDVPVRGKARADEVLLPGERAYLLLAPDRFVLFDHASGSRL